MKPPAADVCAWMVEHSRSHGAAAEHFTELGFDLSAKEAQAMYRARHKRQEPEPQAEQKPKGRPRVAPQAGQVRDPMAPIVEQGPPQLPATVPPVDPTAMTEEELLGRQLQHLWLSFYAASTRDVSGISNRIQEITARLNEVRAARLAAAAGHMPTVDRLRRLAESAATWPDAFLEVAVRVYLERKKLGLLDTRTGQRIDRLVFPEEGKP